MFDLICSNSVLYNTLTMVHFWKKENQAITLIHIYKSNDLQFKYLLIHNVFNQTSAKWYY